MTAKETKLKKTKALSKENQRTNDIFFSFVCAFLIGIITWCTDAGAPQESLNPNPKNSYYNLLVQGFSSGQLNMKMDVPPELEKLTDPYDPNHAWNTGYWANKVDTSYYNGKFYLYFGVTPALVLFWPYVAITGHYLSDRCAVAIIFALGFFIIWQLLSEVRRRYFPETSFGIFAPGILIPGLSIGLTLSGTVHMVAIIFGLTFVVLALAGIWLALHWPAQRVWGLSVASLSYGLAIGSRPSLLFGAITLLMPVIKALSETTGMGSIRRAALFFISAVSPIILIGIGLMVYNDLRFGNPFELGRRYMLTFDYESPTSHQFSIDYLWFNVRYYFLEPIHANFHFPFLEDFLLLSPPPGHAPRSLECGSILFNYPFLMLILAVPLIWRDRLMKEASNLSWFVWTLFLLFVICALTDCFVVAADMSYALDFLPPLVLLAFIGFLALDKALMHLPNRRRFARLGWYILLGYSLVFNLFANVKVRAASYHFVGEYLLERQRPHDALDPLKSSISLDPRVAMSHDKLAIAYAQTSQTDEALDEVQKALHIDPECTDAQYVFGFLLYQKGESEEAFKYFEKALKADPMHTDTHSSVYNGAAALLIINNPDPGKRDGGLALKLAEAACQETDYKDAHALVSLAVVYAETGQTNEAIAMAQKAIVEAKQNGETDLIETGQSILNKYIKNPPVSPSN